MNPLVGLLAVPAALSALIVFAALARHLAWVNGEAARKIVHVGMGSICCTFPWLFMDKWPVWLLGGLAFATLLAIRLLRPAHISGIQRCMMSNGAVEEI